MSTGATGWRGALRLAIACLAAGCCIVGCSTPPAAPPEPPPVPPAAPTAPPAAATTTGTGTVLGRSDRFVIYDPGPAETMRSIAALWLGSEDRYWQIADFNGSSHAEAGQPLVVPLVSLNPTGVQADQYQTVPILCYHRFGSGGGKMVISPARFAEQLAWLARNDYRVIRLSQLQAFLDGRQALPKRAVVITVDDGYESMHRHALPLLRKHGFPATLFVYTDFIGAGGDALNWSQLQELVASGLVDVQAHSKTHRNLVERGADESDAQYRKGLETEARVPREILERRLPVQVRHYALPYGAANDTVLDVLSRQRYELAMTVNAGGNAFFAQPLLLRRTMIFGDQDLEAFKAKLQTGRGIGSP